MSAVQVAELFRAQPLLALAVAAIVLVLLGGLIRRPLPLVGGLLRGLGNLGIVAALLLTIAQVARLQPRMDVALPAIGLPRQEVSGRETRIPLNHDGHFWITARIDGTPQRFLVDTGATVTAISRATADRAGIEPSFGRRVMLQTANGSTTAGVASLDELRVGNVVARNLDVVVMPGPGDVNVVGMNFLTKLKSWRVEDETLILVPHHPQAVA